MQPVAYINGQFVDSDQLSIPPHDAGFLMGVTIAEQIRTFNGRPFWLKAHLERLYEGLALAGIEPQIERATLHDAIQTVVANNYPIHSLDDKSDIGITVFVTPGAYASYGISEDEPLVAIHTYPLQFQIWADKYSSGQRAVVSRIREVPSDCWPAALKCRSRMHYFLAGKEAREIDSAAVPILLDHEGFISETPIASIVTFSKQGGFAAPRVEKTLPGISLAYLKQLAAQFEIPFRHADLTISDVRAADEVILTSTPYAAVPMVAVDGAQIGNGMPGDIYSRIIASWSLDVGVDIPKQAELSRHNN